MSRAMMPSQSQLEKLADIFVRYQFLATGHARTVHAKNRTRSTWQEVANTLNSDGNGCIKTWQQWSKYWKDKKAALKRKVSQLHQARKRTGGGAVEQEIHLTAVEERLLASVGGDGFAIGDRELEINPIKKTPDEPELLQHTSPANLAVQLEPRPGPSRHSQQTEIMEPTRGATVTRGQRRYATSLTSSPRRRHVMPQTRRPRRQVQRTPPAQQNSQMASLTERLIAIEERRVEVEMIHARSLETLAQSFNRTSQGYLQHSQALLSLAESIRDILERNND